MTSQLYGSKPFNPILGETFQTKVGNTNVYIEQTCHHPPMFHFQAINPKFNCHGYNSVEVSVDSGGMTFLNIGKFYVEFQDGGILRFTRPSLRVNGVFTSKRFFNLIDYLAVEDIVSIQININLNKFKPKL